jgi:trimeric autotransporter adhesin
MDMARYLPAIAVVLLVSSVSWALQPQTESSLERSRVAGKAFYKPELTFSSRNVPLEEVRSQVGATKNQAWDSFVQRHGQDTQIYIDPRSGTPTKIQLHLPLIPGNGDGNRVTTRSLGQRLGAPVSAVDAAVVEKAIRQFIHESVDVLGIDESQLGPARVTQVTPDLWQVHISQQVRGIPVLFGRLAATISHGNLILIGTENWGNVKIPTVPIVASDRALENGLGQAGLIFSPKSFWKMPALEVVPFGPPQHQRGNSYIGPMGDGYGHHLVWSFGFNEDKDQGRWEAVVDAHTGEVISLQDKNAYADATITGGIYPLTNTDVCPTPQTCGAMQLNSPMPWANTGLAAPNNFTNGAGRFDYTSGTVTTTLNGKYVRVSDSCGAVTASASGDIALGGTNGQHDCTTGGGSAGNTPASRSAFYEVNMLAAQARGWLPTNTWLAGQLTANVNQASTCNAFWNGSTINFYRSGGGCRNTGEIAAVFDHEWGHGIDDFDANGTLSNSSEGYADIAAIYRLQASCVGHGFFWTSDRGCGQTADGTGFNQNEAQSGAAHCNTDCSGVRDSDWAKHSDNTPDTPQNFVCPKCSTGPGPCGRQVHCAAAPVRQAAWDLVTRDLTAAPFSYDSNTAFIVGNKLFYQGSGNVGTWHACDCTAGTADGCGATNGYMQWLAADDDNGNLNDGTPHMTAIYNAFNRHNIACSTPARVNAGCSGGPTAASALTASGGDTQVGLSWTGVAGATKYWVMKTEGFAGCNFGKTLTATVTTTSYTDTEVANGRQYCYSIVGAGASNACFGVASNCTCATPQGICTPPTTPVLSSPANGGTGVDPNAAVLTWNSQGGATYDVQVATDSAFTNVVRSATAVGGSSWTVTPALSSSTSYFWHVRAVKSCGSTGYSSAFSFTTAATCAATTASYNATQRTPACSTNGCGCDTGATLVNGRGTMAPAEPNQPNTVGATCADGSSGTYHSDESVDRVKIETTDATALDVGKQVKASITVWCYNTTDALDFYYATNAATPTWTAVATNVLCPVSGAAHTFVQSFTLGGASGLQAIRAQLRFGGTAGTCTTGSYNDRDDLTFQVGTGGCTVPAAPALASPANGATGVATGPTLDWGDSAGATSYDVQVATDAAFASVARSASALAASTWTVTPALGNNTTYFWRARASNSCGSSAWTGGWSFTTQPAAGCTPSAAAYSATLLSPGCTASACGCDSGASLLNSRGTMLTSEPNRPNTLGGTCADGNTGTYHSDESIDRMVVKSVDGLNLAVGKQATVDVTVWCYSSTLDFLDLYYSPTTSSPTWTAIATGIVCPGTGARTISRTFTLGSTAGQHAVRAQFRYQGSAGTCTTGSYNDRDDLNFNVATAANGLTMRSPIR